MSRLSTVVLSTLALTVAVATAAAAAPDKVGIFKKYATHFYEDANGNLIYDGAQNGDHVYQFFPCAATPLRCGRSSATGTATATPSWVSRRRGSTTGPITALGSSTTPATTIPRIRATTPY